MKNTKIRKPLSILLAILMIAMTCSVAFGVSAEDETTDSAVNELLSFLDEQSSFIDEIYALSQSKYDDSTAYSSIDTSKDYAYQYFEVGNTTCPASYYVYNLTDYADYLLMVELMQLVQAASIEWTNSEADISAEGGSYTTNGDFEDQTTSDFANSRFICIGLQALIEDTEAFNVIGTLCPGSSNTTYMPVDATTVTDTVFAITYAYVGAFVTTNDIDGYMNSTSVVDYGVAYGLDYELTWLGDSTNGYVRCLANEDAISTYVIDSNSIPTYLESVPTSIITDTTYNANLGSCGDGVYAAFDSTSGTLYIYCDEDSAGMMTDLTSGATTVISTTVWYDYFNASSIKNIVFTEGITHIGNHTFSCSNYSGIRSALTSITLPSTLESIGQYAFYYNSSLTSVTIPEGVTTIGQLAFAYTGITDPVIPSTVTFINNGLFRKTGTTTLSSFTYSGDLATLTISTSNNTAITNILTADTYHSCTSALVETVVEPTCVDGGYTGYSCTACDYVYETDTTAATGHVYSDTADSNSYPATCSKVGMNYFTCTVENCSYTLEEEVPVVTDAHNYVAGEYVDATCYKLGYTPYECEYCDASYEDEDASSEYLAHTDVNNDGICDVEECGATTNVHVCVVDDSKTIVTDATCTTGEIRKTYCVDCGKLIAEVEDESTIDKDAHTVDGTVTEYAATCIAAAYTETYYSCCGVTVTADVEGSTATGNHVSADTDCVCDTDGCDVVVHTSEDVAAITSDCQTEGFTAGTKCSVCDVTLTGCTSTGYGDHSYSTEANSDSYAATCTKTGMNYYSCTVDGCTDVKEESVDKDSSNHSGELLSVPVDPTCTENGYTYSYYSCCGDAETAKTAAYEAANADGAEVDEDMEATGHTFATEEELEAETATYVSYTSANADGDGYWTVKCANCDATTQVTDNGSQEEFLADEQAQADAAALATAKAAVESALASFTTEETSQSAILVELETAVSTALGDDTTVSSQVKSTSYNAATCGVDGSYDYSITLTVGAATATIIGTQITLKATGAHTFATADELSKSGENYTAANCSYYDTWTDVKCADCDATTTVYGTTYGDCSFTYVLTDLTEEDENYTPATATTEGFWTITCDYCDKTTQVENAGSKDAFIEEQEAAADEAQAAADLAAAKEAAEIVAAALADFTTAATSVAEIREELETAIGEETEVEYSITVETYTAPTCCTAGSYTYTVTFTVGEQTATTESTTITLAETDEHTYEVETVASTCCTKGTITTTCSVDGCDYEEVVELELDPTNHAGTATEVIDPATCTEDGLSTITYSCCDTIDTAVIPATGHTFATAEDLADVTTDYTDPTCTEDGYWTVECSSDDCTETTKVYDTGSATGHTDEGDDGICDVCGESTEEETALSVLLSIWQKIVDFINSILSFFDGIGDLT